MEKHCIRYMKPILIAYVALLAGVSAQAPICYYPDGNSTASDLPCNQSAIDTGGHSACCNSDNFCLENGLCLGGGVLSRGSCTDPEWGESCAPYCHSQNPTGGTPIAVCDWITGSFVCNAEPTSCTSMDTFTMNQGVNNIVLRDYQVAALEKSPSATALLLQATSTLTPADDTSSDTSCNSTSSGTSVQPSVASNNASPHTVTVTATQSASTRAGGFTAADVAGAAVGVGVPLLLTLVGAAFMIFTLRRRLRKERDAAEARKQQGHHGHQPSFLQSPNFVSPIQYSNNYSASPAEVTKVSYDGVFHRPPSGGPPTEMSAERYAQEMEAASPQDRSSQSQVS